MHTPSQLLQDLSAGRHDPALAALYALDGTAESLDRARERAEHVVQSSIDAFSSAPETSPAPFRGGKEIFNRHANSLNSNTQSH